MTHCKVCNAEVSEQPGAGRPADYCSTVCRRAIEKKRKYWDMRARQLEPGGRFDQLFEHQQKRLADCEKYGDDKSKVHAYIAKLKEDQKQFRIDLGERP